MPNDLDDARDDAIVIVDDEGLRLLESPDAPEPADPPAASPSPPAAPAVSPALLLGALAGAGLGVLAVVLGRALLERWCRRPAASA